MGEADKTKWDKKYSEKERLLVLRDPSRDLTKYIDTPRGKRALDVACGVGRNTIFMAQNGFSVDALDISEVAIAKLSEYARNTNDPDLINPILTDLESFTPQEKTYDLIVMANYLDRRLIPKLSKALAKGGLLIIDTYMRDNANDKPQTNPDFLLAPDELPLQFDPSMIEILGYREYWSEGVEQYRMRKGSIVVRKIT